MKKILAICIIAVMSCMVTSTYAQQSKQSTPSKQIAQKVVIETVKFAVDVDCKVFEKKIVTLLEKEKGVKDVKVDIPKKIVTVSFDKAQCNSNALIKSLALLKIKAHVVK
ncbi:MAG: cation transporter [Rikenellaceae bacterium]